jgi:hypothetical protein
MAKFGRFYILRPGNPGLCKKQHNEDKDGGGARKLVLLPLCDKLLFFERNFFWIILSL